MSLIHINCAQVSGALLPKPRSASRHGFATFLVLWVVGLASVVIVALQSAALSESVEGREALARVRAYWAARAGVEATIARLGYATENPDLTDAFAVLDDMADVAEGAFAGGASVYRVSFTEDGKEVLGPADAHAKLNVNLMTRDGLMLLPYMTEDVADSILDWIDDDDDSNPLGAEVGYYQSLPFPCEPRNAPMRTIQELELVAGTYDAYVRAEDWNLNGRADANEQDGDESWPPDDADETLDGGWSELLTTLSVDDVLTPSGEERLDLTAASAADAEKRIGVSIEQARTVVDYAQQASGARLGDYIRGNLAGLLRAIGQQAGATYSASPLTNQQLTKLVDECSIGAEEPGPRPGKLNINTCTAEMLQYLPGLDPAIADSIIVARERRPEGFASIIDLIDDGVLSRAQLSRLYNQLTVRSNVYVVSSRGRDASTGLEVEMIATVDRSTLPVTITDLVIR